MKMAEDIKMAKCACDAAFVGLYACSGGSNVGQMTNKVAVELTKQGKGKIMCTVGIGAAVPGIMKSTEGTDEIVAIDGCSLVCAKKSLERAGFSVNKHIVLTELGIQKNKELDLDENEVKEVMSKVDSIVSSPL
jgi:uncharacterized metal-binding protein